LAADPSIYDYDNAYDTIQAQRNERARQAAEEAHGK
jgi:hypothetical protein